MLVTGVYELAGTIAATKSHPRVIAGGVAAFLVGVGSNLVASLQLFLWLLPKSISQAVAGTIGPQLSQDLMSRLVVSPSNIQLWRHQFVVPGTLNQTPFIGWFIGGGHHAHQIGAIFLVCFIGILFSYYKLTENNLQRSRYSIFVMVPLSISIIAFVNSWGLPTSLGLLWLVLATASRHPIDLLPGRLWTSIRDKYSISNIVITREITRIISSTIVTAIVAIETVIVASPFLQRVLGGGGIVFLPPTARSSLLPILLIYLPFLILFFMYYVRFNGAQENFFSLVTHHAGAATTVALLWIMAVLFTNTVALLLLFPLLIVGWITIRTEHSIGLEALLMIAGAGLILFVEWFYFLYNVDLGRYNAVFKV
jgi:uncharacterized membrane protein